jgi:hypothetical protein
MKKYLILLLLFIAYVFPKDVSPVISIRYDNLDDDIKVTDAIGLKFDLGNGKYSGFDSDGTDYRIYVGSGIGKIGLGHDGTDAEYSVGTNYELVENIELDIEYVFQDVNGNIRVGININF